MRLSFRQHIPPHRATSRKADRTRAVAHVAAAVRRGCLGLTFERLLRQYASEHPAPISEAALETRMRSLACPLVAAEVAATSAAAQVVTTVPPGPTHADPQLRVTST